MEKEEIFQYKSYLFTVAYNMTGDVQLSEDLVQDTFEKWLSGNRSDVKNAKAYLSRIIVNKTLDRLEQQKKERELYKGVWLPEPVISESGGEQREDVLDYAFLYLLEKLNPYERAVFVLREVLGTSYEETSEFLDITQDNCRQLLHRAKEKLRAPRKTAKAEAGRQKELLYAFLTAAHQNDVHKLQHLLKEDIMFYSDGGGKAAAALKPLSGVAKVMKFLIGVSNLEKEGNFTFEDVIINGGPALIIYLDGAFHSFIWVEIEEDKIINIFSIRNPDKISHLNKGRG